MKFRKTSLAESQRTQRRTSVDGETRRRLRSASVETSPEFHAGTPHLLFEGPFFAGGHDYAVTRDGKGFILIRDTEPGQQMAELKVIVNWAGELKRRLPVK